MGAIRAANGTNSVAREKRPSPGGVVRRGNGHGPLDERIMTTRVGLLFPPDLSLDDWTAAGQKLYGIAEMASWCLGDWLAYGQLRLSGRYQRAADRVGLDIQTLRNYAWLARKFPPIVVLIATSATCWACPCWDAGHGARAVPQRLIGRAVGLDSTDDHGLEAGSGGPVGEDPGSCDLREVVNAIFYQNRTGCQWRFLPHDFPAWSAVLYYFRLWREVGLDQQIQELLRCQVREKARRLEDPSLVIIDTQSVRAAAGVPKTTTGLDANKKVSGRKRGLAVDVLGLVIGVVVLAASTHDNVAGTALLDQAADKCGMRLEKALVDQGFKDEVVIHGALMDIDVEVVRRNPADQGKGFVPQPKRWVVEQVNGTLMLHRRLAREYDHRLHTSASRVYWASIANMTRRLTTPSPTWRDSLELAA